jgi:hypothetical protein
MEVVQQRRSWLEKHARETCWCSLDEALARVTEPGLRRLLVKFAKDARHLAVSPRPLASARQPRI